MIGLSTQSQKSRAREPLRSAVRAWWQEKLGGLAIGPATEFSPRLRVGSCGAVAVALVGGFSFAVHCAQGGTIYSTGFETTPDSAGNSYSTGNLLGQNGWVNAPGEPSTGATIVSPGLSGSQALELSVPGSGTSANPIYYDFYNSNVAAALPPAGDTLDISFKMNTSIENGYGSGASPLAGLEVFDGDTNIVASLFAGYGTGGLSDLLIGDGNNGLKGVAEYSTAGDGATGNYTLSIDPSAGTFSVSYNSQIVTSQTFSPIQQPLTFAFSMVDRGAAGSSLFDNLDIEDVPPVLSGGSGSLVINNGAQQSAPTLIVGASGGTGTITLGTSGSTDSGASLTSTGSTYVGGDASGNLGVGVINVYGGTTLSVGDTLKIWNSTGTSVNLAGGTIDAGTLDTSGNPANFNWTSGTLNLTNSSLAITASGPLGASLTLGSSQALQRFRRRHHRDRWGPHAQPRDIDEFRGDEQRPGDLQWRHARRRTD